jgi:hypothetical protein
MDPTTHTSLNPPTTAAAVREAALQSATAAALALDVACAAVDSKYGNGASALMPDLVAAIVAAAGRMYPATFYQLTRGYHHGLH